MKAITGASGRLATRAPLRNARHGQGTSAPSLRVTLCYLQAYEIKRSSRLNGGRMMAGSEVLSARVEDGVALITLGSPTRIFFDPEMSDALLEAMTALAGDEAVRVLVVTGGAPGYFVRHYSVAALISMGERLKGSGQQWSEDTPYTPGSFAKAIDRKSV